MPPASWSAGSDPTAPRNNLDAMRSRLAPSSGSSVDLPQAKTGFRLARPSNGEPHPLLAGMQQGELLRAPQSSTPSAKSAPVVSPHFFTPPTGAPATGTSTTRSGSSSRKAKPTLDEMPLDKLQSMIMKHQEEKIALLEESHQSDDEVDQELVSMKLTLLTKRIAEMKAAVTARSQSPSSSGSTAPASTPIHLPRSYPTPSSVPPRAPEPPQPLMTASSHAPAPLPQVTRQQPPRPSEPPRRSFVPDSPPEFDDFDLAMAEEDWDEPPSELVPPSSPPAAKTPERHLSEADKAAAVAEMDDVALEELFSSPIRDVPNRQPVRVEQSIARSDVGGPGPSSMASRAMQPKHVAVPKQKPWDAEVKKKLREVFKLPGFRTNQHEAINATMEGKDAFVLMPTGGGKSLTYQLPAICSKGKTKGVTVVVSPLISLINDQTRHLINLDIPTIAYTGDLTMQDKRIAITELSRPEPYTKIIYVTPEMLSKGGQIKTILGNLAHRNRLARFVIDEAHCVSAWGHDFREDYLRLGELRKDYPGVPMMALTATAPNRVKDDIIRLLGIQGCQQFQQSFNRPNLHYEVREKKKGILDEIAAFINVHGKGQSGIVYCSSRDKCEIVAKELRDKHKLPARHYHAGMTKGDRRHVQEGWQERKFDIIVATVAFGMGIDKPDVRYVIHHSLPRSLEGYYQETGRAGRDGKPSTCILFYTYRDSMIVFQMIDRDHNLTRDQKERQKENIKEVLRFCENKTDCRRTRVLSFFSETFDPADCHGGCDVCLGRNDSKLVLKDVTDDAKNVIEIVRHFVQLGTQVTQVNIVDCFRGVKGSAAKELDRNPLFGVADKSWDRGEAERLVEHLLIEGALKQYHTANRAGWSNSYVRLPTGSDAKMLKDVLAGKRKVQMDFREPDPAYKNAAAGASKPSRSGARKPAASAVRQVPLAQRQATLSNTLSRKRSAQQIAQEMQEFDDSPWASDEHEPIEVSDDENDRPSTSAAASKKRRTGAGSGVPNRNDTSSPTQQCFKDLQALCKKYSTGTNRLSLSNETVEMLALMLPTNATALRNVEGVTVSLVKAHGTKILGITTKYHRVLRPEAGSKASGPALPLQAATRMTAPRPAASSSKPATKTSTLVNNLQSFTYPKPPPPQPATRVGSNSGRVAIARTGSASGPRF